MTKKPTKRALKASPAVQDAEPTAGGRLTQAQLIGQVGAQAGLTKVDSTGVVITLLELLAEALTQGKTITLPDLGTFSVKDTAARTGRNLRTGESMQIPAGKKVAFKAAPTLKSSL